MYVCIDLYFTPSLFGWQCMIPIAIDDFMDFGNCKGTEQKMYRINENDTSYLYIEKGNCEGTEQLPKRKA